MDLTKEESLQRIRVLFSLSEKENIRFWLSNTVKSCKDGRLSEQEITSKIKQLFKEVA